MIHKFDPKKMNLLDNEQRKELIPPHKTLKKIGLISGHTFLDIGAGIGYFTFPALDIVGNNGKVIAIDVSKEMIDELKKRSEGHNLNLDILLCEENKINIPDGSIDIALMGFVLHEIADKMNYLKEVRRVLKYRGKFTLIEWIKKETAMAMGPPLNDRLDLDDTIHILTEAGFRIEKSDVLNPFHYYIIAKKTKN